MQDFRLEKYLSDGVERILRGILRVSDPRGSFFMLKFMAAEKRARRLREIAEEEGGIFGLLIASITSQCNLHCKGCYARASGGLC